MRQRHGFTTLDKTISFNRWSSPLKTSNGLMPLQTVRQKNYLTGFTLIELIITISIFLIAVLGILELFSYSAKIVGANKARLAATGLATKQIEIIRNMSYNNIGTTLGWPHGNIPSSQTIKQNEINYTIKTIVDNVDDSFDGLFPIDTTGADYKKVEIKICWDKFPCQNPVRLTTNVSPKGLEIPLGAGALKINVLDASGVAVPQATVEIENTSFDPDLKIVRETNNSGYLMILDLPPSGENYHLAISKDGYTKDYTIAPGSLGGSIPIQSDLRVIEGELTEKTFFIDLVSNFKISTLTKTCSPVSNISFDLKGEKLIGRDPDVFKYDQNLNTGGSGKISFADFEFDTYSLTLNSILYDLAGTKPLTPLIIPPGSDQDFDFILTPHQNNTLLVLVKDNGTGLVLSNAEATLSKTNYEKTLLTGKGIWRQTDWQGGAGQENWQDENKYFNDDGNINAINQGEIKLAGGPIQRNFNEPFDNTNYKDSFGTTADWDIISGELKLKNIDGDFTANGVGQSLEIDTTSLIIAKAYLSANQTLNGQTINYYLSADGGENWENVIPGVEHTFINQGNDLRFKAELFTTDSAVSPSIQSISISYTDKNSFDATGYLISSSFDTGTIKTIWGVISWDPENQAESLGINSVKLQIATNNDNTTWIFRGPDGAEETYYTISKTNINPIHNEQRYVRYKIFLSTEDTNYSPMISDITSNFTSSCSTPGQVFFSPLEADNYDLKISLEGYQEYNQTVAVSGNDTLEIYLNPNP